MTLLKYPHKIFTRGELIKTAFGEDYEGFDYVIDTEEMISKGNYRQRIKKKVYQQSQQMCLK